MIEAISRRDWSAIEKIGKAAASDEREKKHYQAAHKISEALEVALSRTGIEDSIGTVASPLSPLAGDIPSLLHEFKTDDKPSPILSQEVLNSVDELIGEWRHEERLKAKGISPRRTILLHGLPGCGKSHLASHIAKTLNLRLFVIRFDNLISSYLGETGANIRKVFDFVMNNRCALFIDELDAIAKQRDDRNELGELKRVVITLLQNLDISAGKSILLAGTNHAHMLDSAIWRRFEIILELLPPKRKERIAIFTLYLDEEIPSNIHDALAQASEGLTGSDIFQICNNAKRKTLIDDSKSILTHLCFSILEHLDRSASNPSEKKTDERKIIATLTLKLLNDKLFSFQDLESLCGIPKSTLHLKYSNLNGIKENVR
ncbi:MAG: ATP-binding protein [Gammaproteobacteria bacterium]|nr:ATP-binding protein [Gammaproteobacteria bacterium]